MHQILLATSNEGKRRELSQLFAELPVNLLLPSETCGLLDVAEDAETFEGNARKKARAYLQATRRAQTHERDTGQAAEDSGRVVVHAVLADDSGLEVPLLGNAPGVHSARYAGLIGEDADRANLEKLLATLLAHPSGRDRRARAALFRCALVYWDGETEFVAEGRWDGWIASEPRGQGGFGYDPIFALPDGRTAAELSPQEKAHQSHRGRASETMRRWLRARLRSLRREPPREPSVP